MRGHCDHKQEEHDATKRLTNATYVLAIVTTALVLATIVLAHATYEEKTSEPTKTPTSQEASR